MVTFCSIWCYSDVLCSIRDGICSSDRETECVSGCRHVNQWAGGSTYKFDDGDNAIVSPYCLEKDLDCAVKYEKYIRKTEIFVTVFC